MRQGGSSQRVTADTLLAATTPSQQLCEDDLVEVKGVGWEGYVYRINQSILTSTTGQIELVQEEPAEGRGAEARAPFRSLLLSTLRRPLR